MGLFGSSTRNTMRSGEVSGSLDLQRERDAASAIGIRVVGLRVVRESEDPVDGPGAMNAAPSEGARHPHRRLLGLFRKQELPSKPGWAERPNDLAAYPPEWEAGLRRFVNAFEREEARERAALTTLGMLLPKQVGHWSIKAVGVDAWIRYVDLYRFSSLDVTPPSFEIPPDALFVTSGARSPTDDEGVWRGHTSGLASRTGVATAAHAVPSAAVSRRLSRDPYAFYRLLDGSHYVYHLYENGLGANFPRYWLAKFEPLVEQE